MSLDTQEQFTAALRELCEERDLELIVEETYASSGYFSLQHPKIFEPVLRFPFDFHAGYSSFVEGIGDPGPLGTGPDDVRYSWVRGGEHDVLVRVARLLDEPEDSRPAAHELARDAR